MIVHKGKLRLVKQTKATVVYGNDVLAAIYVPKKLISKLGLKEPPESVFLRLSTKTEESQGDSEPWDMVPDEEEAKVGRRAKTKKV